MSGSVWLAGRIVVREDEETEDQDSMIVFNGIYETYALAFASCEENYDFITEVKLNEPLDYENLQLFFPCKDGGLPA